MRVYPESFDSKLTLIYYHMMASIIVLREDAARSLRGEKVAE